ncbi:MAG: hypothetical protein ACRDHF_05020 [Tepidiformaceae bacterium]
MAKDDGLGRSSRVLLELRQEERERKVLLSPALSVFLKLGISAAVVASPRSTACWLMRFR